MRRPARQPTVSARSAISVDRFDRVRSPGSTARVKQALIGRPRASSELGETLVSALDVTVQAQILELIERLQSEHGTAVICRTFEPPLVEHGNGHLAGCHHPLNASGPVPARP